MGYQELIAALHQDGEAQVETIRRENDAAAEQIRAETSARLQQLRSDSDRKLAAAIATETKGRLAAAAQRVRMIRLAAERELAQRLFALAQRSLKLVAAQDGESLFVSLAAELPPGGWEEIKVNPLAVEVARRLFPEAEILTDASISGGLEVSRGGGTLRIVNTLEKRLERGWPEILPLLLQEVCQETVRDGTAEPD